MFKYIFYRLYLAYKKHEPNTNHGFSAALALSAFQFFMIGGVMIVLSGCLDIYVLPKSDVLGIIIALGFMALLVFFNYKHYTPKIEKLDEKFANLPVNKWLKDWSFLFIPFLFAHLMK